MTVTRRALLNSIAIIAVTFWSIGSAFAALIAPTGATQTAGGGPVYGSLLLVRNGAGLSGSGPVASQLHNERPDTSMWLVGGTVATVVFDLGAIYELNQMLVWNYAEGTYGFGNDIGGPLGFDGSVRGAKDVNVYYSDTNPDPAGSPIPFVFAQAIVPANSAVVGGAAGFGEDFGVAGVAYSFPTTITAQYIKFDILTNIGGSTPSQNNYVGLSEVRFNVVPEPTAAWLLICGAISTVLLVRRRTIAKKALLIGALSTAFAWGSSANASPIIFDSFTGNNGDALDPSAYAGPPPGHTPNINVPGSSYVNSTDSYNALLQSNTVTVGADIGVGISIQSAGAHVKPTTLTISGDISVGTMSGADYFSRGIGLGFFSNFPAHGAPPFYNGGGYNNFQGLVLRPSGNLALVRSSTGNTLEELSYAGAFNNAIFHSLSYQVDTVSGEISNVVLDGTGYSFTTGLSTLTDANTKFAGFYGSSNSGSSVGYLDNFMVVPEPTAFALSLIGLVGFAARRRFQG